MEENLVGYLLDALEPDTRGEVEQYLRDHPDAHKRLELLRQALEPLECDRDTIEPPPGLRIRTLACIAEHRCQTLPAAPAPVILRAAPAVPRTWWRRADVLVAASILFCVVMLLPPSIVQFQYRSGIAACQNNLREFYETLRSYSDFHDGQFPNVAQVNAPRHVAGMVVPVLQEQMRTPLQWNLSCPPQQRPPIPYPPLDQLTKMNAEEVERLASEMLGSYAYSLGHREGNSYVSDRFDRDSSYRPLMSDRPPFGVDQGDLSNSPNHGGWGQNVLFGDGRVDFFKVRTVGPLQDDIFINQHKRVAAGIHVNDAVLGAGSARPDW